MDYMTLKEASKKWGVSSRQVNYYCVEGRIPGAVKIAGVWLLPKEAAKPMDRRYVLSGGAQQCTAIARALVTKPSIVLADEPTGSFDIKTTQNVAGLLKMTAATFHQTLIVITHNLDLAQLADRVVRLKDGKIV